MKARSLKVWMVVDAEGRWNCFSSVSPDLKAAGTKSRRLLEPFNCSWHLPQAFLDVESAGRPDQTRFCYLSALMMLLHFQLSRIGLNDVLGPFNYVIAVNKLQFGLKSRIENSRMMYRRYGHLRSIPLYLLVKQERMFF